jgi:hypothetical protein
MRDYQRNPAAFDASRLDQYFVMQEGRREWVTMRKRRDRVTLRGLQQLSANHCPFIVVGAVRLSEGVLRNHRNYLEADLS